MVVLDAAVSKICFNKSIFTSFKKPKQKHENFNEKHQKNLNAGFKVDEEMTNRCINR